jgi:hypothetical protein
MLPFLFLTLNSFAQGGGNFYTGLNLEPRVLISDQDPYEYTAIPSPSPLIGYGKNFKINESTFLELSVALKSFSFNHRFTYKDDENDIDYIMRPGIFSFTGYNLSAQLRKELWSNTFFLFGISFEKILSSSLTYRQAVNSTNSFFRSSRYELEDRGRALVSLTASASKVWWVNKQNTRPIELRISSFLRFSDYLEGEVISRYKTQSHNNEISTGRLGLVLTFHYYINKQFQE